MGWKLRGLREHVPQGPCSCACPQDPGVAESSWAPSLCPLAGPSPSITCETESGPLPSRNSAPGGSVDSSPPQDRSGMDTLLAEGRSTQWGAGEESGDHTHSARARALGSPALSPAVCKALPAPGLRVPPAGFSGQNNAAPAVHTGVPAAGPSEPVPGELPWLLEALCMPRPWVGHPPEPNHGRASPSILSLDPGRCRERLPRASRGGPHHPPLTGAWPGERTQTGILGPGQRWGPLGAVLTEASVKTVPSAHSSSPPSDYLNFIMSISGLD